MTKLYMIHKLFVDTSWFKAFSDPKDDFYEEASQQFVKIKKEGIELVTTNFMLDESYTLIRNKVGYESAMEFRELLKSLSHVLELVRILPEDESNAWNWFIEKWSNLSFTDCTSFAVMKRLGLLDVATFDQHFAKAGFKIFK